MVNWLTRDKSAEALDLVEIVEKGRRLWKERKEGKGRKRKGRKQSSFFQRVGLWLSHHFSSIFLEKNSEGS